jgi:hypothetical protein
MQMRRFFKMQIMKTPQQDEHKIYSNEQLILKKIQSFEKYNNNSLRSFSLRINLRFTGSYVVTSHL